jgi:hypothetical protein
VVISPPEWKVKIDGYPYRARNKRNKKSCPVKAARSPQDTPLRNPFLCFLIPDGRQQRLILVACATTKNKPDLSNEFHAPDMARKNNRPRLLSCLISTTKVTNRRASVNNNNHIIAYSSSNQSFHVFPARSDGIALPSPFSPCHSFSGEYYCRNGFLWKNQERNQRNPFTLEKRPWTTGT